MLSRLRLVLVSIYVILIEFSPMTRSALGQKALLTSEESSSTLAKTPQ